MTFPGGLDAFNALVQSRLTDLVTECGIQVQRSMVEGSELTGAPGQPVDVGTLKGSFVPERIDRYHWQTATVLDYAPAIENGVGPYGALTMRYKRGHIGGFHSQALTVAGWGPIVEASKRKVVGE